MGNSQLMSLFGLMISGPRPSEWPQGLLPDQQTSLPLLMDCGSTTHNCHDFDAGENESAPHSLNQLEQLLTETEQDTALLGDYFKELALFSLVGADLEKSRKLAAQVKPNVLSSPHYDHLLSVAEAALQGGMTTFRSALDRARELAKKSMGPFLATDQADWLERRR